MQAFRRPFRRLLRQPGTTFTAVGVLAAGIGLSAAALSPLWRAVIAAPPLHLPGRIVAIYETSDARQWTDTPASPANLADWSRRSSTLAAVAFHASARDRGDDGSELLMETPRGAELVRVLASSTNLFQVLGRSPANGRDFVEADGLPGAEPVIVLSDAFARAAFGAGDRATGQRLRVEGVEHLVIGVMAPGFWFPHVAVRAWTPLRLPPADFQTRRQARILRVVARVADGVTVAHAREDLRRVAADLAREYPRTNGDTSADLQLIADWMAGPRRGPYRLAALCGGLLLAIALVNASVLAWTSLTSRERELAVTRALGASRRSVVAAAVAESALLAIVSAVLAWPIGTIATALSRTAFGGAGDAGLHWLALALTTLASTTGLMCVVAAIAWRQPTSLQAALLGGQGRTIATTPSRWPVAVQTGLAVLVMGIAVAAVHGYADVARVATGHAPVPGEQVAVTITLRGPRYREPRAVADYFQALLTRVRALPGVVAAGATAVLPLHGAGYTSSIWMPEMPGVSNLEVRQREITAGYASASGLPVLDGREFVAIDAGADVALVNAAFVARYCHGRSPIGLRLFDGAPDRARTASRIVGVVGDERLDPRGAKSTPMVYRLHESVPEETMTVVARGNAPVSALLSRMAVLATDTDPAAVALRSGRLEREIAHAVSRDEAIATLSAIAAVVAVLMAVVGVLGLSSLDARRLRRDLAIRAALGAAAGQLAWMIWARWAPAVSAGSLIGLVATLQASGAIRAALPAIQPTLLDTLGACGAVAVAAALAVWPSARRVARVDPACLLRDGT